MADEVGYRTVVHNVRPAGHIRPAMSRCWNIILVLY